MENENKNEYSGFCQRCKKLVKTLLKVEYGLASGKMRYTNRCRDCRDELQRKVVEKCGEEKF